MGKTDMNMIVWLTTIFNLNPKKPQHHNIHYTDLKSGYGQVFLNNE